jgi:hypothetical protein
MAQGHSVSTCTFIGKELVINSQVQILKFQVTHIWRDINWRKIFIENSGPAGTEVLITTSPYVERNMESYVTSISVSYVLEKLLLTL